MQHTVTSLRRDLDAVGIRRDDTVLVHSSFKTIGDVERRADGVLDAFMECIDRGLLVFPTLTYNSVKVEPPYDCRVFSVNDTPTCVGILTELFRKRSGVVRSWHPTHSVAAFGKDAAAFTEGHERFDSPCARTSPWGKMWDRKTKILFIGTGTVCNTMLHGVEEWANVPNTLGDTPASYIVIAPDGRHIKAPSRGHIGQRWLKYPKIDDILIATGVVTRVKFGGADCLLADTPRMVEVTMQLLKDDIDLFGHDRLPKV